MSDNKKPAIGNLFKNAAKTANSLTYTQGGTKARTCPQCGAPRPADASLKLCDYRNFRFLNNDVQNP